MKITDDLRQRLHVHLKTHSMKSVAEATGLSIATISNFSYGITVKPHFNTVHLITQHLGLELSISVPEKTKYIAPHLVSLRIQ